MVAVTQTGICNMALSSIRTSSISSITENSANSRICLTWYDISLEETLELHQWTFATRRQSLARHSQEADQIEWAYRYTLPADYVKARDIINPAGDQADPVPFAVESADDGTMSLLCNLQTVKLRYTFLQKNPAVYTPGFTLALAAALAKNIAYPVTAKEGTKDAAKRDFATQVSIASAADANASTPKKPRESEFVRGRS